MEVYKITYNDFGIAYVFATTFQRALTDFSTWYEIKFKDKDWKIRAIEKLVGDAII